jgi:putative ABC transport system substrate-binding protein
MNPTYAYGKIILTAILAAAHPAVATMPAQNAGLNSPKIIYIGRDRPGLRANMQAIEQRLNSGRRLPVQFEFAVFVGNTSEQSDQELGQFLKNLIDDRTVALVSPNFDLARAAAVNRLNTQFVAGGFADPVATGTVPSLRNQGVDVTGYTAYVRSIDEKRLSVLKETVPSIRHVGMIIDKFIARSRAAQNNGNVSYKLADTRVSHFQVETVDEAIALVRKSKQLGIDAWYVRHMPPILLSDTDRRRVIDAVTEQRLPAIYDLRRYTELGGLLAYQPEVEDAVGIMVRQLQLILEGIPAREIPFETPRKVNFSMNMSAAKIARITPPATVARRLNAVFECKGDSEPQCAAALLVAR